MVIDQASAQNSSRLLQAEPRIFSDLSLKSSRYTDFSRNTADQRENRIDSTRETADAARNSRVYISEPQENRQADDGTDADLSVDFTQQDIDLNFEIKSKYPTMLFAKVLAKFEIEYGLYRSSCLSKLMDGIIVNKKSRVTKSLKTEKDVFDPVLFYEYERQKFGAKTLEQYGYQKRMLKFDFKEFKILFLADKNSKKRSKSITKLAVSSAKVILSFRPTAR